MGIYDNFNTTVPNLITGDLNKAGANYAAAFDKLFGTAKGGVLDFLDNEQQNIRDLNTAHYVQRMKNLTPDELREMEMQGINPYTDLPGLYGANNGVLMDWDKAYEGANDAGNNLATYNNNAIQAALESATPDQIADDIAKYGSVYDAMQAYAKDKNIKYYDAGKMLTQSSKYQTNGLEALVNRARQMDNRGLEEQIKDPGKFVDPTMNTNVRNYVMNNIAKKAKEEYTKQVAPIIQEMRIKYRISDSREAVQKAISEGFNINPDYIIWGNTDNSNLFTSEGTKDYTAANTAPSEVTATITGNDAKAQQNRNAQTQAEVEAEKKVPELKAEEEVQKSRSEIYKNKIAADTDKRFGELGGAKETAEERFLKAKMGKEQADAEYKYRTHIIAAGGKYWSALKSKVTDENGAKVQEYLRDNNYEQYAGNAEITNLMAKTAGNNRDEAKARLEQEIAVELIKHGVPEATAVEAASKLNLETVQHTNDGKWYPDVKAAQAVADIAKGDYEAVAKYFDKDVLTQFKKQGGVDLTVKSEIAGKQASISESRSKQTTADNTTLTGQIAQEKALAKERMNTRIDKFNETVNDQTSPEEFSQNLNSLLNDSQAVREYGGTTEVLKKVMEGNAGRHIQTRIENDINSSWESSDIKRAFETDNTGKLKDPQALYNAAVIMQRKVQANINKYDAALRPTLLNMAKTKIDSLIESAKLTDKAKADTQLAVAQARLDSVAMGDNFLVDEIKTVKKSILESKTWNGLDEVFEKKLNGTEKTRITNQITGLYAPKEGRPAIPGYDQLDDAGKDYLVYLTLSKLSQDKIKKLKEGNNITWSALATLVPEVMIDNINNLNVLVSTAKALQDLHNAKEASSQYNMQQVQPK